MLIYKVVNKINGKIYVGQTIRGLEKRKTEHLNDTVKASSFPFHLALKKYGKNSFYWTELKVCNSIEELNESEEYWIKELGTISPNGYNLQTGGNNFLVHEETKTKMRENHADVSGENNPMYGKKRPELSERMSGKNHPMYGKKRPEHSRFMSGENNSMFTAKNHPQLKLTESDVIDIRNWYEEGMLQREIAKIKNIAPSSVSDVVNYKSWKHVG